MLLQCEVLDRCARTAPVAHPPARTRRACSTRCRTAAIGKLSGQSLERLALRARGARQASRARRAGGNLRRSRWPSTMLLGDPPERHEAPVGGVVHVRAGTPLQTVNDGEEDLVVMHMGLLPTTALRCSPPPCRRWRRHLTRRCSAATAAASHVPGTSLLGAECGHGMRADRVTLIGKRESRLGPVRRWSTRPAFVAARASPRRSPSALLRAASRALGDQPNVRRRSLIRTMRCSASVGDRVNPRRS